MIRGLLPFLRARMRTSRPAGTALLLLLLTLGVGILTAPSATKAASRSLSILVWGGPVTVGLGVGGWLGEEVESGGWTLWAVFPWSPLSRSALRMTALATVWLLLMGSVALLAVLAGAALHPPGVSGMSARIPGLLVPWSLPVLLVWVCGAAGLRQDAAGALVLGVLLLGAELAAVFLGPGLGPLRPALHAVGIPLDALGELTRRLSGAGSPVPPWEQGPGPLRIAAVWVLGWAGAGSLVLHFRTRRHTSRP